MIRLTNGIEDFFEGTDDPIVIYGLGKYGRAIIRFMTKCNYSISLIVDQNSTYNKIEYENTMVCQPRELRNYNNKSIRIIVAAYEYKSILEELILMQEEGWNVNCLCLVPVYRIHLNGEKRYCVNRLLGYFRKRLITEEMPTIISNNCIGGLLYESLFCISSFYAPTPTISIVINNEDFIKLSNDPEYYLKKKIVYYRTKIADDGEIRPCGLIDDIEVEFAHTNKEDTDYCIQRWNDSIKSINWERVVFIAREKHTSAFPVDFAYRMSKCRYPYLIIQTSSNKNDGNENVIYDPHIMDLTDPLEEHFDLIGWYNKVFSHYN